MLAIDAWIKKMASDEGWEDHKTTDPAQRRDLDHKRDNEWQGNSPGVVGVQKLPDGSVKGPDRVVAATNTANQRPNVNQPAIKSAVTANKKIENVSEDEEPLNQFKGFLKDHGCDEETINRACDLGVRRKKGKDQQPVAQQPGAMRPAAQQPPAPLKAAPGNSKGAEIVNKALDSARNLDDSMSPDNLNDRRNARYARPRPVVAKDRALTPYEADRVKFSNKLLDVAKHIEVL